MTLGLSHEGIHSVKKACDFLPNWSFYHLMPHRDSVCPPVVVISFCHYCHLHAVWIIPCTVVTADMNTGLKVINLKKFQDIWYHIWTIRNRIMLQVYCCQQHNKHDNKIFFCKTFWIFCSTKMVAWIYQESLWECTREEKDQELTYRLGLLSILNDCLLRQGF